MQGCLFRGIFLSTVNRVSGRIAIVVVEEATQARPCFDDSLAPSYVLVCVNYAATQSLMVALSMVVFHVLIDSRAKMPLSEGNNLA